MCQRQGANPDLLDSEGMALNYNGTPAVFHHFCPTRIFLELLACSSLMAQFNTSHNPHPKILPTLVSNITILLCQTQINFFCHDLPCDLLEWAIIGNQIN